MPQIVRSYSKINLGLAIGPARPDGFHSLLTVYQTLALHDEVAVEAAPATTTSIVLTASDPGVPLDERNTAWRMATMALGELGRKAQVRIHIEKRLPMEAGLGGGSANAAAALVGLERELGAELSPEARLRLAARIGSDVPLFLLGGAVLGTGRGELVSALPDSPSLPCVLALPSIAISTPQAYRDWDALQAGGSKTDPLLTSGAGFNKMERLSRSIALAFGQPCSSGVFSPRSEGSEGLAESPLLALVRTGIENDFEQVVFPQYPLLGEIKRVLQGGSCAGQEAIFASLSGSGSALFGLYRTSAAAGAAASRLGEFGAACIVTRTLPRIEYL